MDNSEETIKYIKIFLLVVLFAALISLSFRIFLMFKNSSFRYATFNVLLTDSKNANLIHIDRNQNKMSIVYLPKSGSALSSRSRFSESLIIGIPVDGKISAQNVLPVAADGSFLAKNSLLALLFNSSGTKLDNLNSLDLIKIFLYTKQISQNDRSYVTIKKENLPQNYENFFDKQIFNEKESVQIINGADISGLGSRVAGVLKNAGYNVIATSNGKSSKSYIKSISPDSISTKRLQNFLNVPVIKSDGNSIADITVVLGEDISKK